MMSLESKIERVKILLEYVNIEVEEAKSKVDSIAHKIAYNVSQEPHLAIELRYAFEALNHLELNQDDLEYQLEELQERYDAYQEDDVLELESL